MYFPNLFIILRISFVVILKYWKLYYIEDVKILFILTIISLAYTE